MKETMFCFQCQETAQGKGCKTIGVCGKKASTAALMDGLLFVCRGIGVATTALRKSGHPIDKEVDDYLIDALFSTVTNANFDETALMEKLHHGVAISRELQQEAQKTGTPLPQIPELEWCMKEECPAIEKSCSTEKGCSAEIGCSEEKGSSAEKAAGNGWGIPIGVLRTEDEDLRSLKELVTYGLKGMAAYMEHARNLKYDDSSINAFMQRALSGLTVGGKDKEQLMSLVMETGEYGVKVMRLLDKAHTETYGHPEMTKVKTSVGIRPGILVSGHDLSDLEQLLQQSEGKEIDIYTHGEMLAAHYYPLLKKYGHLKGNYGGSWWQQREDFATFNGPILMTTNCIVPPRQGTSYAGRLFTTGSAGCPGAKHIGADAYGNKDFRTIIEMAQKCEAPEPLGDTTLTGGFGHQEMERLMDKIVSAVKSGAIKKFVVMAGCDGRMPSREYYTAYARQLPPNHVILTAGCAKYRYNKLALGEIEGIPRVIDAGQCNDSYSLVLTVLRMRELLGLKDVNELPIIYNIAWYEQKAVLVLLTLLSVGVKNITLGPTLPAFLSPNVKGILAKEFGIKTI